MVLISVQGIENMYSIPHAHAYTHNHTHKDNDIFYRLVSHPLSNCDTLTREKTHTYNTAANLHAKDAQNKTKSKHGIFFLWAENKKRKLGKTQETCCRIF